MEDPARKLEEVKIYSEGREDGRREVLEWLEAKVESLKLYAYWHAYSRVLWEAKKEFEHG